MVLKREIEIRRSRRDSRKADRPERLLCRQTRVDGRLDVPSRPGFVWVREIDPDGHTSPFHAFNIKVAKRADLDIWVERNESGWEVVEIYTAQLRNLPNYRGDPYLPDHARSHEWPDGAPANDAVNVFSRALVMLRAYPGEAGGLTVSVAPLEYVFDRADVVFGGEHNIDISPHQPAAGSALFVGIYLDTATNAIATVAGAAVQDAPVLIPPKPVFPNGAKSSARARLDGDQTEVTEADFYDARKWLGEDATGLDDILKVQVFS